MRGQTFIAYRDKLLPASETFVPRHYAAIDPWRLHWACMRRVPDGYDLGDTPVTAINAGGMGGRLAEGAFRLTGAAPVLDRMVRDVQPALLHAHFGKSGARILPLARRHSVPLIVSFHGGDATKEGHFRPFWQSGSAFALRKQALAREAALFLTDSAYLGERLADRGFPPERIRPYHIGVDTDLYRADPGLERALAVLFVGRFVEKKGIPDLIEAMARVQKAIPQVGLAMIGDGPLRGPAEELARQKLVNVRFAGWQTPEQVRAWMNRVRLVAVPSVVARNGDCEGLPSVVYEAQAMSVPVVGTTHSGIPEGVRHGETGLLSPERDPEALAENILAILSEDGTWERMSTAARQFAETSLSVSVRGQELIRHFERVSGRT